MYSKLKMQTGGLLPESAEFHIFVSDKDFSHEETDCPADDTDPFRDGRRQVGKNAG